MPKDVHILRVNVKPSPERNSVRITAHLRNPRRAGNASVATKVVAKKCKKDGRKEWKTQAKIKVAEGSRMVFTRSSAKQCSKYVHALILGGLLIIPTLSSADGTSYSKTIGMGQKQEETQLAKGHRSIVGIVEEINENTIRVNAGDAGDISPRYLNLQNNLGKGKKKLGDTPQIEVNAQNEVVRYQKIIGSTEKNK